MAINNNLFIKYYNYIVLIIINVTYYLIDKNSFYLELA